MRPTGRSSSARARRPSRAPTATRPCWSPFSRLETVHAESTAAARARGLAVSPRAFRTLALAALLALFAIVCTGATVRLTASGLGCEHWPGCQAGHPFPEKDYHSFVEFGNRLAVIPHLLLSFAVLGGALLVWLDGVALATGRATPVVPDELRRLAAVLVGACFALVVSGTFATAAGPHSGGDEVKRFGRLDAMLVVHAGAVAVFGLGLVFLVGYLAAHRAREPRLFRLAAGLVGLVLVQMGLGELQYRTHLPWWLVLGHVALAASVWSWTVLLAAQLRRPLRPLAGNPA